MLTSEQNTKEVREQVKDMVTKRFKGYSTNVFYEHGHWWTKVWNDDREMTYDVVDVSINGEDGLDLELVDEIEF